MADVRPSVDEITIADLQRAYRAGELTAVAVVREYLRRIERLDRDGPRLNAVLAVDAAAERTAAELDRRLARDGRLVGPLHGVPIVVKDNILTADLPTTFGSIAMDGYRPRRDATAVARLRAAGAIVLAKTTLPDWAASWFSYSSLSGSTRNPYDLARDPGGSSSGTAAAVAANLATAGLGTDCGGSTRLPASFCGLVGLRTTPGVVPRTGSSALVHPQDTVGPMARTVADAARLLDVIAGYDPADPYSAAAVIGARAGAFADAVTDRSLAGVRLGLLAEALGDADDPDGAAVNRVVRAVVDAVRAAGGTVVEVAIPDLRRHLSRSAMYADRARHDIDTTIAELDDPPVASIGEILAAGRHHPRLDFLAQLVDAPDDPGTSPAYLGRFAARHEFTLAVEQTIVEARLDALLYPTTRVPAPTLAGRERWTTFDFPTNTRIASQSWTPAIALPGGFTEDGVPVGVELLAKRYDERHLLRVAAALEAATAARRPPALG